MIKTKLYSLRKMRNCALIKIFENKFQKFSMKIPSNSRAQKFFSKIFIINFFEKIFFLKLNLINL